MPRCQAFRLSELDSLFLCDMNQRQPSSMNGTASMVQWCGEQMRRLEQFHATRIAGKWPAPFQMSKSGMVAVLAMAIIAVAMNVHVRTSQYEAWHNTPGFASPDSAYLFSTTDAPYFLRLAGALKRGETNVEFESLLAYPDNRKLAEESPETFT